MRRRRTLWGAIAVLLLAATSCSRSSGPVEIPSQDLPFDLSRSPVPSPSGPERAAWVYFTRDGHVVPVNRTVPEIEPLAQAAMDALLAGPTTAEQEQGLASVIPIQTRLLQVGTSGTIAEVDLSGEFQSPAPPGVIRLRVAQVVWTLVGLPSISAVLFSVDGEHVSVLTGAGIPVDRPVSSLDFSEVGPAG